MSVYRPPFIKQLDGSRYAGLNCTMASAAMAAVRHTRGANPAGTAPWYPTPSYLRGRTGDSSGGTTLAQADSVLIRLYNINLDIEYNLGWEDFLQRVLHGEGAILQGGYSAIRGTKYSGSETFGGNHAVYINEAKWNETFNRWDFLWYDPLCDGRRAGIPKGPQWVPGWLVKKFASALMVTANSRIGANQTYCAFTRDTEDVIEKFGGVKLASPVVFEATKDNNARRAPRLNSDTARRYTIGELFKAFQKSSIGNLVGGSRIWYGDADGTRWVPAAYFKKVS